MTPNRQRSRPGTAACRVFIESRAVWSVGATSCWNQNLVIFQLRCLSSGKKKISKCAPHRCGLLSKAVLLDILRWPDGVLLSTGFILCGSGLMLLTHLFIDYFSRRYNPTLPIIIKGPTKLTFHVFDRLPQKICANVPLLIESKATWYLCNSRQQRKRFLLLCTWVSALAIRTKCFEYTRTSAQC